MAQTRKGIPEGFHSVAPYLIVKDAASAIEFYKKAFGAIELFRWADPNGVIRHGEIRIGDTPIMLVDEPKEFPEMRSIQTLGSSPIHLHFYVEDADATIKQAIAAGAQQLMPPETKSDGERRGGILDPFGFTWWIATQVEDISREALQKRLATPVRE